ncbi:hypothetical protein H5410_021674 [Solanum commersonii]|uniref:NADH-ubiquinone oxidoreductase chain 4 n=1 Tax=Solanum commersonii TaxID=4109 RepID=A0A9J5ZBZ9_SOLCO|nr:hypothetical protein H5410_021674 [Solanum commersonii]
MPPDLNVYPRPRGAIPQAALHTMGLYNLLDLLIEGIQQLAYLKASNEALKKETEVLKSGSSRSTRIIPRYEVGSELFDGERTAAMESAALAVVLFHGLGGVVIGELEHSLLHDIQRRSELQHRLSLYFIGRNEPRHLPLFLGILERQFLLEKRVEAALVGMGFPPDSSGSEWSYSLSRAKKNYSSFSSKFKNTTHTINWSMRLSYYFLYPAVLLIQIDPSTTKSQFVESLRWLPYENINCYLGVDDISLFFVILTIFLIPICILVCCSSMISYGTEYITTFIIREFIIIVVFCILDLSLFYVLPESVIIPMLCGAEGIRFETKKDEGSISIFSLYFTWIYFYVTSYSIDSSPNRNNRFTNLINHII